MKRALAWMPCLAALALSGLPGCMSPSFRTANVQPGSQPNAIQQQLITVARSYELQGEIHRARQLYSELAQKYPHYSEPRKHLARLDSNQMIDPTDQIARQHAIAQAFEREGRTKIAQRFYANLGAGYPVIDSLPTEQGLPAGLQSQKTQLAAQPRVAPQNELPQLSERPTLNKTPIELVPQEPVAELQTAPAAKPQVDLPRQQKLASRNRVAPTDPRQPAPLTETIPSRLAQLSHWLLGRRPDEQGEQRRVAAQAVNFRVLDQPDEARQPDRDPALTTRTDAARTETPQADRGDEANEQTIPAWHETAEREIARFKQTVVETPASAAAQDVKAEEPTLLAKTDPPKLSLSAPSLSKRPLPPLPTIEPTPVDTPEETPVASETAVADEAPAPLEAPVAAVNPVTVESNAVESTTEAAPEPTSALDELARSLPEKQAGLVRRLGHREPRERTLAAYLLGKSDEQLADRVLPALQLQFKNERDTRVKIHLAEAMSKLDPADERGMDALLELLGDENDRVRWLSVIALSDVLSTAADRDSDQANSERISKITAGLTETLQDETPRVRSMAALALAHLKGDAAAAIPALTRLLEDEEPEVREAADAALACIRANQTTDEATN